MAAPDNASNATPLSSPRAPLWPYWLALGVLLLDQGSKWLVLTRMTLWQVIELTPWLNLVSVRNRGAAFSFLAQADGWQRAFFIGVGLLAAVVLLWLLRRAQDRLLQVGLALILGGALGNVVDRMRLGEVVDFVDVYWRHWHWPAFNVADSAISIAVVLLVVRELRHMRQQRDGAS